MPDHLIGFVNVAWDGGVHAFLREFGVEACRFDPTGSTNSGSGIMERYGGGAIVVADYDPEWPAMFEQERAKLEAALGSLVVTIEHVGSTAVPGLAAKPIIDLAVGVRSLAEAQARCIDALQALGYTYMPEYRSWLPDELFFRKGVPGPWTHHVHVMEPSASGWERRLLFRDYLRAHPDTAEAYMDLKRRLAIAFKDDVAAYRTGKGAFVQEAVAMARREFVG